MTRLRIERLGARGEGVARNGASLVFVPYALAGETVEADIEGDHARLIEIIARSPDRIAPFCPHFTRCGGCAVQSLAAPAYAQWKRGILETALRNAGLAVDVAPLVDAHGAGRRRVVFHARMEKGRAHVGLMAARAHEIVEIDACPLLVPELSDALPAARAIAGILAPRGKPLDLAITSTPEGMDMDLRGCGALDEAEMRALIETAAAHDLARLSNHGRLVSLRRAPFVDIGPARVALPPGSFLQPTAAGEAAIAARVLEAAGASRVADLFCGLGAFALRLAQKARVDAYDSSDGALEAMRAAARGASGLKPLNAGARNLFTSPLSARELEPFEAVVFDPPRAGAQAQAREIAKSSVRRAIAVSCSAQSFARDAEILLSGGFSVAPLVPIDQFWNSAHLEIVAVFTRGDARKRPKRRLLG